MLFQTHGEELGRIYLNGETIIHQGDPAASLFIIEEGEAEVVALGEDGQEIRLSILKKDDIFGEISCLDEMPRSASVRAMGKVRVISVDGKGFLRRVQEDPSLALRIFTKMAERIRSLNSELIRIKLGQAS